VAGGGDTSHSLPLQYQGQHGACRVGARPLPRAPSAGGGDRGAEHTTPPFQWSQASIDGVAAAQPAASAKSGEWIGEGAVSASRARRVREAK
jgi:hypothetical protein